MNLTAAHSVALIAAVPVGFVLGWLLVGVAERALKPARALPRWSRWMIAAATALLVAATVWAIGLTAQLPAFLVFAAAAIVLSAVDLAEKRLPNVILVPAFLATLVLLGIAAAVSSAWQPLIGAVLGAAALFAAYFVLALISPNGIGMGDVKLAALIGLVLGSLGWSALLIGALAGFIVGGLVAIVALALRTVSLRGSVPFGPSMLAGAFLAILLFAPR